MDYIEILQEILRYIDAQIADKMSGEKLNIEKIAQRAGFSPYHFYRVFQWEVGYSLMEYVRDRRLFYAASELSSDRRIIDIAVDYGFETHSGFSKAFRRYFGSSPEKYRMYASFDVPKLPVLKTTRQYVAGGIIMEPKIVGLPVINIAGYQLKASKEDGKFFKIKSKFWLDSVNNSRLKTLHDVVYEITAKFWQEHINDNSWNKLHAESFVKSHSDYGVCFINNCENGESEFEYVIGLEVKDGCDIPSEYHICTIPKAMYAVFRTPPADEHDFGSSINGTWKYIFSEWFPSSGYEFSENGADFCVNDEDLHETGNVCDIYIPIIKRQF